MNIFEGSIITCDKADTICRYLVEENGKITFTGDHLPERYADENVIDLKEKALIPGFTDSHVHFSSYALFSSTLDVRTAKNFKELGDMIRSYSGTSGAKTILGFGISAHSIEEGRMITCKELDDIEAEKPVMLIKYDGHACVVNSAMLSRLPKKIQSLRGYNVDTGQLFQEAFFEAADYATSKVSLPYLLKSMLSAVDRMAEKGISIVHPAEGVGFFLDLDVDLIRFLSRGLANPFLFRLFFQTMEIKKVLKRKLPRIGGCFATALDGCFGSRDAALIRPYHDNPDNKGILFYTDDEVFDFVQQAHDSGLQVQLHAIGDAAFDQAASAFEAAQKNNCRKDHRHSIIHASLVTQKGLEICAEHDINIAAQPAMLHFDLEPTSYLESILGDRTRQISPYRTMLDMGIHISGGSDAPVCLPDPTYGIYCACNHYIPEQSISVMQALKMFTYETAWAGFDEKSRGSLEAGKNADMAILNRNPFEMDTKNLALLDTEMLYLNGVPYKKGQGLGSLIWNALFKRSS